MRRELCQTSCMVLFPGIDPIYAGSSHYPGVWNQRASQCHCCMDRWQSKGTEKQHGVGSADYLFVLHSGRLGNECNVRAYCPADFWSPGFDSHYIPVLVIMGLGAIFASLSTPINSMLQAVGRVDLPVKILAVGLAIKVAINYVFSGIPEINILGAGAGTLVCYLLITILGMILLCRVTKIRPSFLSAFVKPACHPWSAARYRMCLKPCWLW